MHIIGTRKSPGLLQVPGHQEPREEDRHPLLEARTFSVVDGNRHVMGAQLTVSGGRRRVTAKGAWLTRRAVERLRDWCNAWLEANRMPQLGERIEWSAWGVTGEELTCSGRTHPTFGWVRHRGTVTYVGRKIVKARIDWTSTEGDVYRGPKVRLEWVV